MKTKNRQVVFAPTIRWSHGVVRLIDQTLLPLKSREIVCRDAPSLWRAIRRLSVRGAPALGVAAALGVLLGNKQFRGDDRGRFIRHVEKVCAYIGSSRPTAVNLFHALAAMQAVVSEHPKAGVADLKKMMEARALAMIEQDRAVCRAMGRHGRELIPDGAGVMTICNAGALATVDYGTALGVMYAAREAGKQFKVYACETRPLLQGARLTAWELTRAGIDVTLICDNMAATVLRQGKIQVIITGADRIAANGDTANKIGTYSLAVLARHHGVPFYVAAPRSTFDPAVRDRKNIPIEERSREEVVCFAGRATAPKGVKVYNPSFDVTDARLISGFITERGVIAPPFTSNIRKILDFKERRG